MVGLLIVRHSKELLLCLSVIMEQWFIKLSPFLEMQTEVYMGTIQCLRFAFKYSSKRKKWNRLNIYDRIFIIQS